MKAADIFIKLDPETVKQMEAFQVQLKETGESLREAIKALGKKRGKTTRKRSQAGSLRSKKAKR